MDQFEAISVDAGSNESVVKDSPYDIDREIGEKYLKQSIDSVKFILLRVLI